MVEFIKKKIDARYFILPFFVKPKKWYHNKSSCV